MSRIRVLSPELADQIAAGEVVERPASVVKELIENALDAGARRIEVEVERGGLGLIAVSDDGSGMTPDEAHLALKRHATSKLTAIEDLFTIASMGFSGEALPSIAAVSKLRMTTRARDAADGDGAYELMVEGGIAGEGRHVGGPVGTRIEVRDLLINVPARLKFMRGEATESAHIAEAVLRLALANPSVHFRLRSDGRQAHDLPPHASGLERAKVALGRGKTPARLHEARGEEGSVSVEAYLGSPADSANTSRGTYLYVNRRFVRDRSLLHSVVMGYGETLERGRYPLAVVHVTMPGSAVDVNVHPQKLEVRFARAQEVYAAVRHVVEGLRHFVERVALRDMQAHPAFPDPADHLLEARRGEIGFALHVPAPEHAHDARALEQREIERQFRNLAVGEADDEIAPAPSDAAKRRLRVLAADRIEDHVRSVAVRERADAFAQVLARIVDGRVRAVFDGERKLFRARRRRDHPRAERLADLDRRESDTACRTKNQHRLAGLEGPAIGHRVVRRAVGERERGGAREIDIVGQRDA